MHGSSFTLASFPLGEKASCRLRPGCMTVAEFLEQFQMNTKFTHTHSRAECRSGMRLKLLEWDLVSKEPDWWVLLHEKRPAGLIGWHDAWMVKSLLPVSGHKLYSKVTSLPWRAASLAAIASLALHVCGFIILTIWGLSFMLTEICLEAESKVSSC